LCYEFALAAAATYALVEQPMEKSTTNKANRRRSPRRRARAYVKVECRIGAHGFGPNLAATTLDIADTGVRMIVKQALELGGVVEFTVSGHGLLVTIKRLARVRWQLPLKDGQFCVGLEFDKRLEYRDWQSLASPS
jgi:PilZ domain